MMKVSLEFDENVKTLYRFNEIGDSIKESNENEG